MIKLAPLTLPDLDPLKPKEPVKESAPVTEAVDVSKLVGEYSVHMEPTVSVPSKSYHIPAKYKDLGDLTQEEWQEIFGRPEKPKPTVDGQFVSMDDLNKMIRDKLRIR